MKKLRDSKSTIKQKQKQEKEILQRMVTIYCRGKKHSHFKLCTECQQLINFANSKIDLCPYIGTKTSCRKCKIHCFQSPMREDIKKVMRYSGPRLFFYHPILTIKYIFASLFT